MFGCKFDNMIEVGFYVIFLKHFCLSKSTYIIFIHSFIIIFAKKNVVKQDKNQAMSATQK